MDLFVGTAGNDTINSTIATGLSALDNINGGAGTDTLNIFGVDAAGAAAAISVPATATVANIEIANLTGGAAVTADVTKWTALTSLNVVAADDIAITAASTTDVVAVVSALSANSTTELSILGGKGVTSTSSDSVTLDGTPATSSEIVIGSTAAAPTGPVSVTHTETVADDASAVAADTGASSTITVTGGTTVTVNSNVIVGASDHANDAVTVGAIGVTGTAATTAVTVNQTAAAARSDTAIGIVNGAVTITDVNAGDATKAGSIASVSLTNFGNSTVNSSAINSVTLGGTGGTFGIGRGALTAVPTANTLALNTNALTGTNTITDSEAASDDGFTTINLTNTGTTVIADLVAADLTTLNIAGSGSLTLTANTLGGALTTNVVSTSTGSVTLSGALAVAANYTGGEGVDKVTAGTAATGTISTGAGNDVITASTLGATGSIDGGEGTDTLHMAAADAATATVSAAFAAKVSNVEQLSLGAYADAAGVTVNLVNMDNINHVTSAGAAASNGGARAQAINGFTTGGTFVQTALLGTDQNVTLFGAAFSAGTADTFNLGFTSTNGFINAGSLTLADVETVAITTTDSDTTAATAAFDPNLDATSVKTLTVTGNAGITFANSNLGTALTSFDASGVTVGPVTYTAGALAAAATITGGAGDDALSGASAAVAGVTINGGAGNDTITGSATKSSTLNGDAGNDTITGGAAADVIDGGAGTNTYVFSSANVVEQAGSGTTTGAVINLSADALTATAVFTATGAYLTSLQASVASGASTYLFSNESNTNASVTDTLANINNATGSNLADYIVGSAVANVITGGAGADVMTGGAGADTFMVATGATGITLATADTITDFATGTDKINSTSVDGDVLIVDGTALANFAAFATNADGAFQNGAAGDEFYVAWNAAGTGNAWVAIDENNNGDFDAGDTLIILTGINLAAEIAVADFI